MVGWIETILTSFCDLQDNAEAVSSARIITLSQPFNNNADQKRYFFLCTGIQPNGCTNTKTEQYEIAH